MKVIKSDFSKKFGAKVRDMRKKCRLSQDDLARAMEISRVQICNIETGHSGTTIEKLAILCSILKCTPNDLVPISTVQPIEYPIYFNIY